VSFVVKSKEAASRDNEAHAKELESRKQKLGNLTWISPIIAD
jgi:hypothetical protein